MEVRFGRKVFLRNAGKDEYWLQDTIYENPIILGFGDLQPVHKEKSQATGGRLDILLKDKDQIMYEVEVMLGETDPSHIIRSIEYWDNEKRKYPLRQHYAVLIAEAFDRRYFNVIQILAMNIPMIAVQVDMLETETSTGKEYILNFTKILDIYAEPEDSEEAVPVNEASWNEKSTWTLNAAKELFNLIGEKGKINYTQSYISIMINGRNAYWLATRTQPISSLGFNVKDDEKAEAIKMILEQEKVPYNYDRYKNFSVNVDQNLLKDKKVIFQNIMNIRHKEVITEDS